MRWGFCALSGSCTAARAISVVFLQPVPNGELRYANLGTDLLAELIRFDSDLFVCESAFLKIVEVSQAVSVLVTVAIPDIGCKPSLVMRW